jgi:hypothetical protein
MAEQASGSIVLGAPAELAALRPVRAASQFPIEVCGLDRGGHFFIERTETCNASERGCKFYLRTEVEREAVVALRVIAGHDRRGRDLAPVLFQVVRMTREPDGWALGALKLRAEDFWPVQTKQASGWLPLD